jgi:Lectin C-type domain
VTSKEPKVSIPFALGGNVMRVSVFVVPMLCSFTLLVAAAAEPDSPPAPKCESARQAKARYDAALLKAQQEFDKADQAARKQYLSDLDAAQTAATKAEDLDEAVRIRDQRKLVEAGPGTPNPPSLPKPVAVREGALSFHGSEYRIVLAQVKTWGEAREMCRKLGGDLASLDTKEKREFLAKHNETVQVWVGAYFDEKTKRWRWTNGSPIAADAWATGRPQDHGPVAAAFEKTALLGDAKDDLPTVKGFICEWKR